ncbi:hypothetical protein [Nonomuraea sp. NPDC052265]
MVLGVQGEQPFEEADEPRPGVGVGRRRRDDVVKGGEPLGQHRAEE